MTDLALYITNKNYSSWSLRIWLLMRALDTPLEEVIVPMTGEAQIPGVAGISLKRFTYLERLTRLELALRAWKALVLPLHHSRTRAFLNN